VEVGRAFLRPRAHWIAVLKKDRRAIFVAAAHAERAVDFMHGLQPNAPVPAETAA